MPLNRTFLLGILCLCLIVPCCAQQEGVADTMIHFSEKFLHSIGKQAFSLDRKLGKTTEKMLRRWQRQEAKLIRKLAKKDSALATQLQANATAQEERIKRQLKNPAELQQYLPTLDTLKTSLHFLQQRPDLTKLGLNSGQVNGTLDKLKSMEGKMKEAQVVQQYLQQRKQLLKEKLSNLGFAKELQQLNKHVYYYGAQLKEYKALLSDHKKAAQKGLAMLRKTKAFQNFMQRNSLFARLFRLPGDPNGSAQAVNLTGLQTRAQVNNLIRNQLASGGLNAQAQFRQNLQEAQNQLSQLKDKITKAGGGSSELDMPEGFKPNPEKTKSFWKRVELGTNIQSQRSRGLLPASSDIGISLGYKLNSNSIIGIGASYKLGWGKDIRHIKISHQGLSVRSFIDYKLKGSFWLTGGYELNYQSGFSNVEELRDLSRWQSSGLIGVSKVINLQNKWLKKTKLMLLWDFLSYQQRPRTQAVLFRIGYIF